MLKWMMACLVVPGIVAAARADDRPAPTDWRKVATPDDRARLRGWRTAWMTAIDKAEAAGNAGAMRAQGALFDPDRALDRAMPPPGDYRCRVFKLGGTSAAMPQYTAYRGFTCRIAEADTEAGGVASFHKIDGSQRPVGLMFADREGRGVFLGTLVLGDEARAIRYGRDATRDMAGFVERVGDRRWRIALPWPRFESTLDVIELVPLD